MGRFLIFLVLAASASSGLLFLRSSAPTAMATAARTYAASDATVAREIAMTGLADAEATLLARLARYEPATTSDAWDGSYGDGSYAISVTGDPLLIEVMSVGTFEGKTHNVRRAYKPSAADIPPFMAPALSAGNNVHLNGPVQITAPAPINTNVHANGNLNVDGRPTVVTGFASAGRKIRNRAGAVFAPNANPGGSPVEAEGAPGPRLPQVDVRAYEAPAHVVLPRNSSIGGPLVLGTRDAPVVVYATGNLQTSAPVVVQGWGLLVVENNFQVNHPITMLAPPPAGQFMVTAGNSIHVDAPISIAGNWFANNNVHFRDDVQITQGSVTAGNNLHAFGALTMSFTSVRPELSGLVWPEFMVPRSHREW